MNIVVQSVLVAFILINGVWCQRASDYFSYLRDCPKECFCPPNFPNALYCDGRKLKEMPVVPARIWYVYLQNNLIETLSESSFKNASQLKWINLNKNKISNHNISKGLFQKMNNLLYLYLEDNDLEEVPSPLPNSLEQLRLARNKISKIPKGTFSNLENLSMLDLHHNKLGDFAFEENTFQGLETLVQLNMAKNGLKKMPQGIPASTLQLFLDNNSIEALPENYFNDLPKLTFVRLNHNKISDQGIPKTVFNVSSILDLQLSHNQLTAFPPFHLKLEHLYLDHNQIKRINGTQICPTPVGSIDQYPPKELLPRLRYLRLDGNGIKPPIPLNVMICFRLLSGIVI
ncbi:keratocan [Callorhinchus milii]|uniref:keratocan n=1 Tax=Callorhinchus milii TaxID=7868 RepID=UPI00045735E1|nr:keratocan [Callorhinchus milii]|eukprot:gi/632955514/ref/XP_007893501.1/ PREDICTED: keratocan [Callorhinchus milii]